MTPQVTSFFSCKVDYEVSTQILEISIFSSHSPLVVGAFHIQNEGTCKSEWLNWSKSWRAWADRRRGDLSQNRPTAQKVHNLKQGFRCLSFTKEPEILVKPSIFRSLSGFLDLVPGLLDLSLGFCDELLVVLGCLVCVVNSEDLLTVGVIS